MAHPAMDPGIRQTPEDKIGRFEHKKNTSNHAITVDLTAESAEADNFPPLSTP
jgi:hypothetical protein